MDTESFVAGVVVTALAFGLGGVIAWAWYHFAPMPHEARTEEQRAFEQRVKANRRQLSNG